MVPFSPPNFQDLLSLQASCLHLAHGIQITYSQLLLRIFPPVFTHFSSFLSHPLYSFTSVKSGHFHHLPRKDFKTKNRSEKNLRPKYHIWFIQPILRKNHVFKFSSLPFHHKTKLPASSEQLYPESNVQPGVSSLGCLLSSQPQVSLPPSHLTS